MLFVDGPVIRGIFVKHCFKVALGSKSRCGGMFGELWTYNFQLQEINSNHLINWMLYDFEKLNVYSNKTL